jgi:23S rRNA (uracil1939-C5)-methyltransferase
MIQIEKIIPGGEALGTLPDGKKIFFWNALPGETVVNYEITKNKSHLVNAIATEIKNPSSHRVEPKDECFLSTSPWQIMDYDYELELKQELIVEIFREHQIEIEKPEIFTDHQDYFYRNKMEYSLFWDHETNQIKLAFHARGSHRKFIINHSSIERPEIFAKAKAIIDDLNARHEEARKYQSLLLRSNQNGEVSVGLFALSQLVQKAFFCASVKLLNHAVAASAPTFSYHCCQLLLYFLLGGLLGSVRSAVSSPKSCPSSLALFTIFSYKL